MKKVIFVLLGCFFMSALAWSGGKTEWPNRPIQIIVPANPGGDTDTTSRGIAESLTKILGRPVQVVNMAGGAGTIAINEITTSNADGYKILYHHVDTVVSSLLGRLPSSWDELLDISALNVCGGSSVLVVNSKRPYHTLGEFVAAAKAKPNSVTFGMETGGSSHIQVLAIEKEAGVTFNKVDIGGVAQRVAALLGGQIDVMSASYGSIEGYIQSGDFVCIGLVADERNPNFSDVPTLKEGGINVSQDWFYFFAFKKGTDPAIVQKFSDAVRQAAYEPPYVNALQRFFYKPNILTGRDAVNHMYEGGKFYAPYTEVLLSK